MTAGILEVIREQYEVIGKIFNDSDPLHTSVLGPLCDRCGNELGIMFSRYYSSISSSSSSIKSSVNTSDVDVHNIAEEIYDICYEQLHTAVHWSDVGQHWRDAFALIVWMRSVFSISSDLLSSSSRHAPVSALSIGDVDTIKDVIRRLDLGLMLAGNTHAVVCDAMHTLVNELHGWIVQHVGPPPLPETNYDAGQYRKRRRVDTTRSLLSRSEEEEKEEDNPLCTKIHRVDGRCLSITQFEKQFFDTRTPVVISHSTDHWPAKEKWTRDKVCRYVNEIAGYRTVPVEFGTDYTREDWSQSLITMNEFIANYVIRDVTRDADVYDDDSGVGDHRRGYLAQHQLFDQIRLLKKDILEPEYCALGQGELKQVNAWFGAESVSPLHTDPYDNLLVQVCGSKYIRLYSADQTYKLYPAVDSVLTNTSQVVDIFDFGKIRDRFPLFMKAPYMDCILGEGEMLFIPKGMWHYVRTIDIPSFSVSYWWT